LQAGGRRFDPGTLHSSRDERRSSWSALLLRVVAGGSRRFLRATFEDVADLYDRARPSYPPELFDDLAALARLPERARILEIGCGTGQATLPLAERGYRITCVELGEQLAAVARRKLAGFRNVEVVSADFEMWEPGEAEFDAVAAFTSFHWISPDTRYTKTASLLRDRGALALVSTKHVLPTDGDDFFVDVQEDYEAVVPDAASTKAGAGGPPAPDAVASRADEIGASGCFRDLAERRYVWDVSYTADEYIGVLNTYSGHRALDDDTRERLLSRIRRRIEARPGRRVRKTYLAILDVAERV
jgi:SAM-dependent methyltransferase